jgi:holin-like protein
MLFGLTILLVFQLVGETLAYAFSLPIPGPVIGMLLLFGFLQWRGATSELKDTAQLLLQHLSLLFVPAGVGIITYGALLRTEWLPIVVTLVASTALTLLASAWVVHRLVKRNKSDA